MKLSVLPAVLALASLGCAQQGAGTPPTPVPAQPSEGSAALPRGTPQAPKVAAPEAAKPDADTTQGFVIGPEDVITILVYNEPSFTANQQAVRPDGIVSMPLVGELKAAGKTPHELEDEISKILADKFLRYTPRVEVRVDVVKSRYYSINGAVNKSGRYDLLVPTTLMQALVNAGGFHEFADLKHIKLLRDGKVFVTFNWNDAIKGKHPENNVYLKQGDLIIIKE